MKIGDEVYKVILDTSATLSIVACRLLKQPEIWNIKNVAIRVGDGRSIHSLGWVDVSVCQGDERPNTAECWTPTPLTLSSAQISCSVAQR